MLPGALLPPAVGSAWQGQHSPGQGWELLVPKQAGAQSWPQAPLPLLVNQLWGTMHHKPCYSKEPKAHEAGLGLGDFLTGKKKFKATLCFNLMWLYDDEKKHVQLQSLSSTRYCHSHLFLSLTLPFSLGLRWERLPCAVCDEITCELLEFLHSNQRRNGL